MGTKSFHCFAALSLLLGSSMTAYAAPIYDNGGPGDHSDGATVNNGQTSADDFVLTEYSEIKHMTFWTLEEGEGSQWDGTLDWDLYADNSATGDEPGTPLFSGSGSGTATKLETGFAGTVGRLDLTEFVYTFDLDLNLPAATYWIALSLSPSGTSGDYIYWEKTSFVSGDSTAYHPDTSTDWTSLGFDVAFNFTGTGVPAPAPTPLALLLPILPLMLSRKAVKGDIVKRARASVS